MLRHPSQGHEWCADGQIGIGEVAPIPSLHLRCATTGKAADLAQDCCRADTSLRSLSNVSRSRPTSDRRSRFVTGSADRDSAEAIGPALAPGAFPTPPPRAWGPAATSTDSPVPLLRTGSDVETRPKSPSGGIRAKEIKVACGMSSPRRTARGKYYAQPIGHSEDRKVAVNRNYCPSVTIRTLGRIYPRLELTHSISRCAPVAPRCWPDCEP
jgi:hypothetical protein